MQLSAVHTNHWQSSVLLKPCTDILPPCSAELLCHPPPDTFGTSQAESFLNSAPNPTSCESKAENFHENSAPHFCSDRLHPAITAIICISRHQAACSIPAKLPLWGSGTHLGSRHVGKITSRLFREVPMPTTALSSRGSPSLPATLTVKHMLLENFPLGKEKHDRERPDMEFNNIGLGMF